MKNKSPYSKKSSGKPRTSLPLFTTHDYKTVKEALQGLSEREVEIVVLRFWKHYTLLSIAEELGLSEFSVEVHLQRAFKKLKAACLTHPHFSRSFSVHLPVAA